jgi:hypothetical protein
MSDVKLFKLVSGDEIFCTFIENDNDFVLQKPVMLIPTASGMAFVPWPMSAVEKDLEEVVVKKDHVMVGPLNVEERVSKTYTEMMTGIDLSASNSELVLPQ